MDTINSSTLSKEERKEAVEWRWKIANGVSFESLKIAFAEYIRETWQKGIKKEIEG